MSAYARAASALLLCAAALVFLPAHAAAAPGVRRRARARVPPQLYRVTDAQGRTGFIDGSGRLRIGFESSPRLAFVGEFSEGLAPACVAEEKTGYCAEKGQGYVDESGRFVIRPRFRSAGAFRGGRALVFIGMEEGGGFIDRRGELVIKVPYGSSASPFSEGLAWVYGHGSVDFIDASGRVRIPGHYAYAEPFSEGLAAVTDRRSRDAKYGFIDEAGRLVIPMRFEPEREHHGFITYLSSFHDGRASVKVGDAYGFIDRRGDLVIPARFGARAAFSEGFACGWLRATNEGEFIDVRGRRAFGRTFKYCGAFGGGLAPVAVETKGGEKWGYIDRRGRLVIAPRFDEAQPFRGALAQVAVNEVGGGAADSYAHRRFGYIDRAGRYVWRQPAGPSANQ